MRAKPTSSKELLKKYFQKIPIISDLYFYLKFPAFANLYRGKYDTYSEAQNTIAQKFHCGYDLSAAHPNSIEGKDYLRYYDYALVSPMQTALQNASQVVDLGGGVGTDYYRFRKAVHFPPGLKWLVCDVLAAAQIGQKLAHLNNCSDLAFTSVFQDTDGSDVLITNGALQYIELSLADLLKPLTIKPQHILINYVPCYEGQTFFTVQNILTSRAPYKIQNRNELIGDIEQLGYKLVSSWQDPRTCFIPFHPACFVEAYHGFHFKLEQTK